MDSFNKIKQNKKKKKRGRGEEKWEAELWNNVTYEITDPDSPQISKQKFFVIVHRLFIPTQSAKFIHVWLPIGKWQKTQHCSTWQKKQQTGTYLYDLLLHPPGYSYSCRRGSDMFPLLICHYIWRCRNTIFKIKFFLVTMENFHIHVLLSVQLQFTKSFSAFRA